MPLTLINFLAALSQTVAGFGAPLISMPFMIRWLGTRTATPVSAFVGLVTALVVLIYYRTDFNLRSVANLLIPSILGVPVGVAAIRTLDANLVQIALGVLILIFSAYSIFKPALPALRNPCWAYLFGFIAGVTGGAYNISGPIIVLYAAFCQWPPNAFRSNLQGYFLVTNIAILISHAVDGNLTHAFWYASLWAVPGALVAILVGLTLGRRINARRFRQLVLALLVVSGIQLVM